MVEVTQEDREAAEAWKWVLWNREEDDPGKAMEKNVDELAQDFARHRIAAENAAMERAAEVAIEALTEAREALHFHYVEWDGEPEDAVPLQLARSKCDEAIRALKGPSNAD